MVCDLTDRNVILTGASKGLGLAIARTLHDYGASLLLVARSRTELARTAEALNQRAANDQQVHFLQADLADPDAPARIVAEAQRVFSSLDGIVNNAATLGPIGVLSENDWLEWESTLRVDLLSPVALCRLCVPWMRSGGGGSIVNLSGGGATGPRPMFTAYATAKAALVRFSETLASELTSDHIRVNCVAPGVMNTDMLAQTLAAGAERAGAEEYRRAVRQEQNGGSPPSRAAQLVAFLLSSASNGINGKLLSAVWDSWENLSDHLADLASSDIFTLRRIVPADRAKEWA